MTNPFVPTVQLNSSSKEKHLKSSPCLETYPRSPFRREWCTCPESDSSHLKMMVGRRSFPFEDDFLAGAMLVSGSVYVCPWAICSPTLRPYPNPLWPYQKSATAWMILGIRPTIRKCVILFPLDSLLRMGMFVSYCWWFRNHAKPVEVGSLSHYLKGFLHPRISSINSRITMTMPFATWPSSSHQKLSPDMECSISWGSSRVQTS